jgi:hypothetical protein
VNVIARVASFAVLGIGAVAGASQLDWRKPERTAPAETPSNIETRVQPAPAIAAIPDIPKTAVEIPKPAVQPATETKTASPKPRKKHRKKRRV